ncbi:MAG: leucyl aminopeptidase family protein [Betaproteobacteria bacterium]|nr:leucyl aminopeptidase family protein [Betaproteobacteria bacterium]
MTSPSPSAYLLKRKVVLLNRAPADLSSAAIVRVIVDAESDPNAQPLIERARALHGDLKPKQLYALPATDSDSPRYLAVLSKEPAKRLAGNPPGAAHQATVWGAQLGALLLSQSALAEFPSVFVDASATLVARLEGQQQHFVVGLLERSTSLKIKEATAFETLERKPLKIWCEHIGEESRITGEKIAGAMLMTRSLVNMPPNILNPESFEMFARELVRRECDLENDPNKIAVEVFQRDKLLAEGCGLINAVGQGSDVPPRLIRLTYFPRSSGKPLKHVSLVGKGITFDSGGLDIKGSSFMRNMKKDMGGSAAALGVFMALARLGAPVRVTCYLALAENMISGRSMRPGDVYKAKNGLTVEIDNTDAEGRLVLADALCYAAAEKPDWLIDLATLTGAARVALGPYVDSLFCSNGEIEKLLVETGLQLGDWVWPLPLVEDYETWLDSTVADVVNSASSGHGGAITAATFLKKFVGQTNWTHIDTYMWSDKVTELNHESGATAKCVRLLTHAIGLWANQ